MNSREHKQEHDLRAVFLLPLTLALAAFVIVHLFTYLHQETEFTEEYVDHAFQSAQHVFDSAVHTNTDKLSATISVLARDDILRRAMRADNKQALLQRAFPVLESLRKDYGITHLYFMRPDRSVLLRVHQPERDGDVIDRFTAIRAEKTGKQAAGLELGPAGTFTLRTVVPWRDGDRLLGYIELGEEIGYVLSSIREMLGLDLFVAIKKSYLSQKDWAQGLAVLNRQGEWDSLPDSVVVFKTMQNTTPAMQKVLAQTDIGGKPGLADRTTSDISDGGLKYRANHLPLIDAGGREVGCMLFVRDVTARSQHSLRDTLLATGLAFLLGCALLWFFYRVITRVEKRLAVSQAEIQESTQRLSLLFQQTPLAVIEWDIDFRVVDWNPAAEKIFGYSKAEAVGRHAVDLILPENAKPHVELIWDGLLTGQGGGRSTNENVTSDGKTIYCEWYNTQQVDIDGQLIGVASLAQDVTDQKFASDRATYLAYFDELTGLPNRIKFKERLLQSFIDASLKSHLVGIIFLDIDHFKVVNDTLGHEAGNELLQEVARRLQGCFRPGDTVARFGGDEFTIAITDVSHVDDVVHVAEHIIESFKTPILIFGNEIFVTFSMGISLYPFDDGNAENLLRNADSAMYFAKAEGRNCYRFYAAAMTERATQHLALQTGLRRALDKGELLLYYQPQLDIGSKRIIGVEALVRWQHPEKGLLSPLTFIPVAEETGLIVPMGEWILREACMQVKAWQKMGHPPVRMAVNLSARQFRDPLFPQKVFEILNETGLDPQYLELEVTESILVDGMESVSAVLQSFKQAGIMIALDDFGTGYSSLSYLKRFPIDKLKIDQTFVRDIMTDASDASLVRAIIAMARALRLRVIAEGVETQGQFDFLQADGCEEIQGYLIGRPMPAEQVAELIIQYETEQVSEK